jgi:hypothetical protein
MPLVLRLSKPKRRPSRLQQPRLVDLQVHLEEDRHHQARLMADTHPLRARVCRLTLVVRVHLHHLPVRTRIMDTSVAVGTIAVIVSVTGMRG